MANPVNVADDDDWSCVMDCNAVMMWSNGEVVIGGGCDDGDDENDDGIIDCGVLLY